MGRRVKLLAAKKPEIYGVARTNHGGYRLRQVSTSLVRVDAGGKTELATKVPTATATVNADAIALKSEVASTRRPRLLLVVLETAIDDKVADYCIAG